MKHPHRISLKTGDKITITGFTEKLNDKRAVVVDVDGGYVTVLYNGSAIELLSPEAVFYGRRKADLKKALEYNIKATTQHIQDITNALQATKKSLASYKKQLLDIK
jgi:prefoldin subunit 5